MAHVKICPNLIPAVDARVLCATVLDSVEKFYQNPENQRRFEQWKREKEEKTKCLKSK
jgi:hypothetical protein